MAEFFARPSEGHGAGDRIGALRPHRRQYLLGPRAVVAGRAPRSWRSIDLKAGAALAISPDLDLSRVDEGAGGHWFLLGRPYEADGALPVPAERLRGATWVDLPALTASWSGKWTIIGGGRLLTDPTGLMGCYYRTADADGSAMLVSSSLPLLDATGGTGKLELPVTARGTHLKYLPPPQTVVPGVRKLLASQTLNWADGRIDVRPLLVPPPEEQTHTPPDPIGRIGELIQGALAAAEREHKQVWLALTGGHDSRLMLAAALDAGVPLKTFTLTYPDMPKTDRDLPPAIARAAGVTHVLVDRSHPQRRSRLRRFDEHTGSAFRERDRFFFARGQYDFADPDDVIIRSGVTEIGSRSYVEDFPRGPAQVDPPPMDIVMERFIGRRREPFGTALDEWRAWALAHPVELDWRVRIYWEVRLGGWLSSVEHSLDLVPATVLQPFNNGELIRLMLARPLEVRLNAPPHDELLRRWAPQLQAFPYNYKDGRPRRIRRRVRSVARDLLEARGLH